MMIRVRRVAAGVCVALGWALVWSVIGSAGRACLPVGPEGMPPPRITGESAIIIWDKAKGIEHFIRRAAFATEAANLAFLVPTPMTPELAESNNPLFSLLQNQMRPEIEERIDRRPEFFWWLFPPPPPPYASAAPSAGASFGIPAAAPAVEILGQQNVAGYEATILKATDAAELNAYLKRNGYPASARVTQWLRPYVQKGWIITAFKVSRSEEAAPRLNAVRMTFATTRPFYPYREPSDPNANPNATPPRSLRIFFLTDEGRMAATLGENGPAWGTENFQRLYETLNSGPDKLSYDPELSAPNHAGVEWAGKVTFAALRSYEEIPGHLTVFLDTQSPRPGTDELYFDRAADQSDIKPAPIYHYTRQPFAHIPIESLLAVPLLLAAFVRLRRKNGYTGGR